MQCEELGKALFVDHPSSHVSVQQDAGLDALLEKLESSRLQAGSLWVKQLAGYGNSSRLLRNE